MAMAHGWRVLCLDGGGTRGIVPLAVLQSLKNRTDKEPWELFDVIVGTSTGGILAVLLGLLKLPVEECFKIYKGLGETVFEPPLFGKVQKILSTVASGYRYSATPLENVVKDILKQHADKSDVRLDELGQEDGGRPYVVLVANRDGFKGTPYRFANFRSNDDDGNTLTNKVRVWEAVRATSAAPTYFDGIRIDIPGVGEGVQFYDGGVNYNNPIEVARTLLGQHPFQGKPPSLFVSLGTGMDIFKMGNVDSLSSTLKTIMRAATDSETAHEHAWQQLKAAHIPYFRFNPGEGLGDLPMDSVAFVEHMRNATQKYLVSQDARSKMNVLVEAVKNEEKRKIYNDGLLKGLRTRTDMFDQEISYVAQDLVELDLIPNKDFEHVLNKPGRRDLDGDQSSQSRRLEDIVENRECPAGANFIVGGPGSGKTTLMNHLALRLAEKGEEVVVLVRAANLGSELKKVLTPTTLEGAMKWVRAAMDSTLYKSGTELESLCTSQLRPTLLVDGLDEIADRDAVVEGIKNVTGFCRRVIVSSRPGAFQGVDRNWKKLLRSVLRIQALDKRRSEQLVEKLSRHMEIGQELARDVAVNGSTVFVGSPLLLYLLCRLAKEKGEVPKNEIDLYERVVAMLLDRRKGPAGKPYIKQLCLLVAYVLHALGQTANNEAVDQQLVENTLAEVFDTRPGKEWLRNHFSSYQSDHLKLLKDVLGDFSGIMFQEGSNHFMMIHRTIQEYQAAAFLLVDENQRQTRELAAVCDDVVKHLPGLKFEWSDEAIIKSDWWDGVYRFSLLIQGGCEWFKANEAVQGVLGKLLSDDATRNRAETYISILRETSVTEEAAVECVKNPLWPIRAAACGKMSEKDVVDELVALLKDKVEYMRFLAVDKLGHMVQDQLVQDRWEDWWAAVSKKCVVEGVVALLNEDEVAYVRRRAAWALGTIGVAAKSKEGWLAAVSNKCVVEGLVALLKDMSSDMRWTAAEALGRMGKVAASHKGVVEGLLLQLEDKNDTVRRYAAQALGKMGEAVAYKEGVLEGLMTVLEDRDWSVGRAAAEALGEMAEAVVSKEEVVEKLLALLKKAAVAGEEHVFPAIADALVNVVKVAAFKKDKLVVVAVEKFKEKLVALLKHADGLVCRAAAEVLGDMGEAVASLEGVVEGLVALLKHGDEFVRRAAAEALGNMALLKDENGRTRHGAVEALGKVAASEGSLVELVEGLVEGPVALLKDGDGFVRRAAAEALGNMGKAAASKEDVVKGLVALLKDENEDVHDAAAEALGKMGKVAASKEGVVEGLVAWLQDKNKAERSHRVAADALSIMGVDNQLLTESLTTIWGKITNDPVYVQEDKMGINCGDDEKYWQRGKDVDGWPLRTAVLREVWWLYIHGSAVARSAGPHHLFMCLHKTNKRGGLGHTVTRSVKIGGASKWTDMPSTLNTFTLPKLKWLWMRLGRVEAQAPGDRIEFQVVDITAILKENVRISHVEVVPERFLTDEHRKCEWTATMPWVSPHWLCLAGCCEDGIFHDI